jgi:hypothetical protein
MRFFSSSNGEAVCNGWTEANGVSSSKLIDLTVCHRFPPPEQIIIMQQTQARVLRERLRIQRVSQFRR